MKLKRSFILQKKKKNKTKHLDKFMLTGILNLILSAYVLEKKCTKFLALKIIFE